MESNLLIFRHTPIDVDVKMYEYFADNLWKGKVIVYAETSFKDCRTVVGYNESADGIQTIILDKNSMMFDESFFREHANDFFLYYGIPFANKYKPFLKKYSIRFGVVAERDWSFYDNNRISTRIKKNIPLIQYFRNYYLVKNVSCFLAMGKVGVECYNKFYRINQRKLYNFMYCDGNDPVDYRPYTCGEKIKFVYVGRFDYRIKGVDTMLNAFRSIKGNYSLDLIGDYGDDAESIKKTVSNMSGVNCIGIIESDKLCEILNHYDIIIVPSNLDGWNLHNNIAINAGIATITTNQSVSHELVDACGNGTIIPAKSEKNLEEVIRYIINNPTIINTWKANTKNFVDRISYRTVASYLYDIIQYTSHVDMGKDKPLAPWND